MRIMVKVFRLFFNRWDLNKKYTFIFGKIRRVENLEAMESWLLVKVLGNGWDWCLVVVFVVGVEVMLYIFWRITYVFI